MDISKSRLNFILKYKRCFSILCFIILLFPIGFIYTEYRDIEELSVKTEIDEASDSLKYFYDESIEELLNLRRASSSFASFNEVKDFFVSPTHANFQTVLEQKWIKEVLGWPLLERITFFDTQGVELIAAELHAEQAPLIIEMRNKGISNQAILDQLQQAGDTSIEIDIDNDMFGLGVFNRVEDHGKLLGFYCLKVNMQVLLSRIEYGDQYEFPTLMINNKGNILQDYFWDKNVINGRRYSETLQEIDPGLWKQVAYHSWNNFYKRGGYYYIFRYFDFPLTHQEYQIATVTRISEDIVQATQKKYLDPLMFQGGLLLCLSMLLTFPFYYLWHTGERFVLEEELKKLPMQSSTPIVITDHKHQVVMINDAALILFETTYEDVKGKDPYRLAHLKPRDPKQIKELRYALAKEGEWSGKLAIRKENGGIIDELINVRRIDDANGMAKYHIGIFYDIRRHTEHINELKKQVEIDSLTGCHSRKYFYKKLEREFEFVKQHSPEYQSHVILLHLENFSEYSRHYGHQEGDLLLAYIGKLLTSVSLSGSVVCRFRGEIFSIVLPFSSTSRVRTKIQELNDYISNEVHPAAYRSHMAKERLSLAMVYAKIEEDGNIDLLLKDMDKKYREEDNLVRIHLG